MKIMTPLKPLVLLFLVLPLTVSFGQSASREEIRNAIQNLASYSQDILLDGEGKARGDYYMTEGSWIPYEPPWHTGQIIYSLVEAFQQTGDSSCLKAAIRAGNWWTSLEIKDNSALQGMVRAIHGDGIDYIVFATVTDGTAGLFRLYEQTGIRKYADIPTRAGIWMLEHMYDPVNGVCYDMVDPETGEVLRNFSPFWEEKENPALFDVARPNNEGSLFLDMYRYTAVEEYRTAFINLCESLLKLQGPEGLWMDFSPNNKASGSVHPRFNLWYAESLLDAYDLTGDRRYLEAAGRTAKWYASIQQKDGTIYYTNFINGKESDKTSITGSATAFAGIIWIRLAQRDPAFDFNDNINRSLNWILKNRFPTDHPDKNLAGATLDTRTKIKKGKITLINRDVGTPFAIRFLSLYLRTYMNPE
jgi:hypothetical protein